MLKVIRAAALAGALVSTLSYAAEPAQPITALPKLAPEAQHATAAKRITALLRRSHYKRFALDNKMAAAILKRYIKSLDYNRSIFLQSDIDAFNQYQHDVDDDLITGKTDFAYHIYQVALKRRYQRFAYALSLLDKPMDFTLKQSYTYDRTKAPWAKSEDELNAIWHDRVKYDELNLSLAGKTWPEIKKTLTRRYNNAIRRLTQAQSEDVFSQLMNAFTLSIDPHTNYLSPRNAERFQMEMNLELEGIGAVLQSIDDYTVIASLVPGGPADKSGQLKKEDKIIGVAQGDKPFTDIVGMRLDDVVELIKGKKGTEVRLQVLPGGKVGAKPKIVTLVRDKIRLEDRAAKGEVYTIPYGEYKGQTVGVINVPSFYMGLSKDVEKELAKLKKKNVSTIIMDLRGDGGGALNEATELSGLFIDSGPVVQVRSANGRVSEEEDTDGKTSYDGPLVVLVDRYSASASEIFAAAMQDYCRALIVGQNTYGKGTVQQHRSLGRLYDLFSKPLGHITYTIAKFYRVNGGSTQRKGVTPDVMLPAEIDASKVGESTEKTALPWDKISPAHYQTLGMVNHVAELTKLHQQRLKTDSRYAYVLADIADYEQHKDDKSISLNKTSREKEREDNDAKRLARINSWAKYEGKPPFKSLDDVSKDFKLPDVELAEAARIALDYAKLDQLAKK